MCCNREGNVDREAPAAHPRAKMPPHLQPYTRHTCYERDVRGVGAIGRRGGVGSKGWEKNASNSAVLLDTPFTTPRSQPCKYTEGQGDECMQREGRGEGSVKACTCDGLQPYQIWHLVSCSTTTCAQCSHTCSQIHDICYK